MFNNAIARKLIYLTVSAALTLSLVAPVLAHPADEANVYHYLWIEPKPGVVSLQHASVVGGLVAAEVWPLLDADGDKELSEDEQEKAARNIAERLSLTVDGKPTAWTLEAYEFPSHTEFFGRSFPAIKLLLTAKLPKLTAEPQRLTFLDETFPTYPPIVAMPVVRPKSVAAGEPQVSEDGRTTQVLLAQNAAQLPRSSTSILTDDAPPGAGTAAPSSKRLPGLSLSDPKPRSLEDFDLEKAPIFSDRGVVLYGKPEGGHGETEALRGFLGRPLSPALIALGLGVAVLAGAAHALTPGHGKSMVAAYLVGSRGTVRDAVVLGIVVTITHTATVYILGALCLWLTTRVRAEVVETWLSIFSGLLVLGMGFWLFQRGLLSCHGIAQPHGHSHDGGHSHGLPPTHADSHSHSHSHSQTHSHSHAGDEGHSHGESAPQLEAPAATSGRQPPTDAPTDEYLGATKPPMEKKDRLGILGLGIAGGMVPCTDALVILLAAVNLGSIGIGLALIFAFSVGMAAVLVAIGVILVTAKGVAARFTPDRTWVRALPAVSGGFLFFLGAWLTIQALGRAGIITLGG